MSDETQLSEFDHTRQPYVGPAIVYELTLETRAGSPLGGDPLSDPLGLDPAAPNS
ncbi:MAG: hypothetical protein HY870_02585 [Chloroflexi bacterium]|nr:hypothetical protein [Chloroflexota bacterium]